MIIIAELKIDIVECITAILTLLVSVVSVFVSYKVAKTQEKMVKQSTMPYL